MIQRNLILLLFSCNLFLFLHANAQVSSDSIYIEAKMWSRDANRNIQYSDWKKFGTRTMAQLQNFKPGEYAMDAFGGNPLLHVKATGFFRTQKINGKWWVIDPLGNSFVVKAMNSLRLGTSPDNKSAFDSIFVTKEQWINTVTNQLKSMGFNCAGSWGDVEQIQKMNATHQNRLPYTTQLNLLTEFIKSNKKAGIEKVYPTMVYVLDEGFESFCMDRCAALEATKLDSNLLGHFSDNELPFQEDLITQFVAIQDKQHPAYKLVTEWMQKEGVDLNQITKVQKDQFAGLVARIYFKTVSSAIKKHDPNHLYIGSRLHSSVKDNPFVFNAMEPYIDIISINYYGYWDIAQKHIQNWATYSSKPFFITEFYTKALDSKMTNISGAGWLVKTQEDRGDYYQNITLTMLSMKNCVGWHWFRYQDNDPADPNADPSNNDSNKGIVTKKYAVYNSLALKMSAVNKNDYFLIDYFSKNK